MSKYSIKKYFSDIGTVEYKIASTRKELEGALALVYREYLKRGYISPKYYKSGLRITMYNALPDAITFIALKDKEVIGAATLIPDSPLGLPLDEAYKKDADKLRKAGRKICEIGQMAIKSELFGKGFFSLFNFKKLQFIFTLFMAAYQYAIFYKRFDDMCIVTNPKLMIFRFLPFQPISEIKYYGYDRIAIKKKAAVLKRMDLEKMRIVAGKFEQGQPLKLSYRMTLYKIFFRDKISQKIFENRFECALKDLHYFFVKKSDIFKRLNKRQKDYIRHCYGLTEAKFNGLLKGEGIGGRN